MILLGSILILQFFIFIVVIVFPSPVFSPLVTDASGSYLRPDGSPAFLAARSQSPYPYKWLEHVQGTGVIPRQSERIILTPKQAETTNPISASSTTPSSTGSAASSSPEQTPAPTPAPLPKSKHVPSGNGEVIFATDATFDNEVKSNEDELVFVEFFGQLERKTLMGRTRPVDHSILSVCCSCAVILLSPHPQLPGVVTVSVLRQSIRRLPPPRKELQSSSPSMRRFIRHWRISIMCVGIRPCFCFDLMRSILQRSIANRVVRRMISSIS